MTLPTTGDPLADALVFITGILGGLTIVAFFYGAWLALR
jgi:hypothetical protein